jgi:hypothetical protein
VTVGTVSGISVTSYGATGNGSTDDKASIQNAINACPSGGTILFPAGTYKISGALSIKANCSYLGQGTAIVRGYTGTGAGGFSLFTTTGSNISIKALIFDGGGIFLPVEMQSGITISGNRFQNIVNGNGGFGQWTAAIWIGGTMLNSSIDHNTFYNIMDAGNNGVIDGQMNGIRGWRLSGVSITDNTFDLVQQGLSISESQASEYTLSAYSNDTIARNVFTRVKRMPIEIQAHKFVNLIIEDNKASSFLGPYWNTFGVSASLDGTGVVIRRNEFDIRNAPNGAGYCMEVAGTGVVVDSNTCKGATGAQFSYGVVIAAGPNAQISNNLLCGGFRSAATAYEPPHVETQGFPATFTNNSTPATCQ